MRRKNKELPEWDDGRTIANMNVEGTPWYQPGKTAGGPESGKRDKVDTGRKLSSLAGYSDEESRAYTWGALKAALLVALVLCGGMVLFVLFCLYVWFR